MNNFIEKLKTTKLLAIIGSLCVILGCVTPYISVKFFGYGVSISLCRCWQGVITLIIAIATLLFILKEYILKYIPSLANTPFGKKLAEMNVKKYVIIPILVMIIFAIYVAIELGYGFRYFSFGFYVFWVGIICFIAYLIINKEDVKNIQQIKNEIQGQFNNNMQNQNNMQQQNNNMQYQNNMQQPNNNMQYQNNMQQPNNNMQYQDNMQQPNNNMQYQDNSQQTNNNMQNQDNTQQQNNNMQNQ